MGIEIKITGSTPMEALSLLASAGSYCMNIPAVSDAAKNILESAKSAAASGADAASAAPPARNPAAPQVHNAASDPAYRNQGGGAPPQNQPPRQPAATNQPPANGFGGYPNYPTQQNGGNPPRDPANHNAPNYPPRPQSNNGNPGYPQNQNQFHGGGSESVNANPTAPETGSNSTMTRTSLFNSQSPVSGNSVPTSNAPGFTIEQVGRAGADLVTANLAKRDELNALLRQYGVQTLAELRPDQLGPFALELRGLGANI